MSITKLTRLVFGCWCCLATTIAVAEPSEFRLNGDPTPPPMASEDTPAVNDSGATCSPDGSCVTDPCDTCLCYRWQVWANGLFLTRSSANNIPLGFGNAQDPKGSEIYGTNDMEFGNAWGPSVGVYYALNACNSIGFEYYGIDGWSSSGTIAGNISVQFPSFPYLPEQIIQGDPTTGYGIGSFQYNSRLYNAEVNLRHKSAHVDWLTFLAGFRWMELSEDFNGVFATGNTTPNFAIDVNNHLYGGQLGAVANVVCTENWTVDTWLKAGLLANYADQDTSEDFTSAGGGTTHVSASGSSAAFTGDMGITVGRRITDNLTLRAGYTLLWLEGVALAPEQLDASDPASGIAGLDQNGGVFYHGGFAGLEFLW